MHVISKRRLARRLLLPGALVIFILSGCATTIKTNVLMPGKADQAAQFRSIAVMPFDGPDGDAFVPAMENTLGGVIVDGQPFFQLVDRGGLDKVLSDMMLGMTGMVNEDTVAQVGKAAGAKAIYTGNIGNASVQDDPYSEKRQKCAFYRTVTDTKGGKTQECASWFDDQVTCTKRAAVFSFTPKLIEVESGRIVFSNTYMSSLESKVCADEGKALLDGKLMQKSVQDEALQTFRRDVAPYYVMMTFTLKDSTADISSDAAKTLLKEGLTFAKASRMDRACPIWREAKALAPDSLTLMYNVGICYETEDRPHEAFALYRQIEKMQRAPDELIAAALTRVVTQIENRKKLAGQVAR